MTAPIDAPSYVTNRNAVVCGRRLCTSRHHDGPRWLPIIYFKCIRWHDARKTQAKYFDTVCHTCRLDYDRRRRQREAIRRRSESKVELAPLVQFLEEQVAKHGSMKAVAELVGLNEARVRNILAGHDGTDPIHYVFVGTADKIFTQLGHPELMYICYPLEED